MSRDTAVVLFARLPVPGKAKTRLAKDVGPDAAADLYRRMAERAFAATASSSRAASRTLCFSEASEAEGIQLWVEAMGDTSLRLAPQCASPDLGERMRYALTRALERGGEGGGRCAKAIVVGTDVPDLSAAHVDAAAAALDDHDVVFGPAVDGGYYLLGVRRPVGVAQAGGEAGGDGEAAKAEAATAGGEKTGEKKEKALAASVTIVVRDAESVDALRERTRRARRVLLVGNGAIAMELADALCRDDVAREKKSAAKKENGVFLKPSRTETVAHRNDRELVWAARHAAVGDAFFDRDAAAFLADVAEREGLTRASEPLESFESKDSRSENPEPTKKPVRRNPFAGNAAGPDWTARARAKKPPSLAATDARGSAARFRRFRLRVATGVELASVVPNDVPNDFPATAVLSDGSRFGVDLIVSAAGVDPGPNVAWLPTDRVARGSDGGVAVDATFRALGDAGAVPGLFAAGDAACCDARRLDPKTRWFPMRLWSQARVSGTYAARVMCGEADAEAWGFNYELFAHTTRFFGVKVILLGLYNAQKLDAEPASDLVSYSRRDDVTNTFARVLLLRGVMVGAVLLGDTDLEETFENLILNQTDLTRFGPALLDPETDLGDYFD